MKEYEIKLSNGRSFYRNDDGSCWLDGEFKTNRGIFNDIVSELSEEIIKLQAEKERLKVEIEKLELSDEFFSLFRLNGSEFKDRHISDTFNDFMKYRKG